MSKKAVLLSIWFVSILFSSTSVSITRAQVTPSITCGNSIESTFTDNEQIQNYQLSVSSDTKVVIHVSSLAGSYESLEVDLGFYAPNGFEIRSLDGYPHETETAETDYLSQGDYRIAIRGYTDTGASYTLYVNCVSQDGIVTSAHHLVQGVVCGSSIDNVFNRNEEVHRYYITMNQNDRVTITTSSLAGSYESLEVDLAFYAPNGFEIQGLDGYPHESEIIETVPLSVSGLYAVYVRGYTETTGNYNLSIGCTLADGTDVGPGEAVSQPVTPPVSAGVSSATPSFSGFGFPGLVSVDFSQATLLQLPEGVPLSGILTPSNPEILGFKLSATEGQLLDLNFTRLSGNLNVGIAIVSANNEVVFQVSLVTSQSFSTQVLLPSSGDYTVGVFQIDLLPPTAPEATVFQLQIQLE